MNQRPGLSWPLGFTPFEYYYYLDDRPTYPTTFPVELHFRGRLDRDCFLQALRAVIARHPLLAARVDASGRVPSWTAPATSEPVVDWAAADVPLGYPAGGQIDLTRAGGLRTWVRASDESALVIFEFHHACCDGLAGLHVAREVLELYRAAVLRTETASAANPATGSALPVLDPALLAERGAVVGDAPRRVTFWTNLRDGWYTLKTWAAILFRQPLVLAPPARSEAAERRNPLEFDVAVLSADETARYRQQAKRQGVTVNDLLLRDFIAVLHRWNIARRGRRRGRLRVNVPVSIRATAPAALPACNGIGYGFVTARVRDADDPERLLKVVRRETGRLKDWKLALYFLGGLAFAQGVPGLLPWAMHRRRSFATAVLSNVGRFVPIPTDGKPDGVWRCGSLTLEWIGGVPPVRPLTRAALIVIEYAGQTSLCLRTDAQYFDPPAAQALLDAVAAQIRQTLAAEQGG